ncbi:MAG: flagellar hook-associated protein FlgK [bacterium]|nr:flagellar hook-associated protein FlgK [bacterium]
MISTFFGLEIARRALFVNRALIDVTSHNVANANTEGYSRQEGLVVNTPPISLPSIGIVGTGAQLSYIRRVRSEFLDIQYRDENRIKNYWDELKSSLEEVEYILGEPSNNGLSSIMDSFWNSWQELSTNPESMSVRGSLKEQAQSLISFLAHIRSELVLQREQLSKDLEIQVDTINDIATQIGALNEEIKRAYIRGQSPNDLLDKRDLLLDKLSGLINFDVRINEVGEAVINIRDHLLVGINNTVYRMTVSSGKILWEDGADVYLGNEQGKVPGIIYILNNIIGTVSDTSYQYETGYLSVIDRLTTVIYERVNELHRSGYGLDNSTGIDFFTLVDAGKGINANNIKINDLILQDLNKIASASSLDAPGDGSNALKIARIKGEFLVDGSFTVGDYWKNQVSMLGIISQRANLISENQKVLVDAISSRREEVSGVSIDEEVINMIKYQQAFSAASRILTTLDEMLSILIERTGVVGR